VKTLISRQLSFFSADCVKRFISLPQQLCDKSRKQFLTVICHLLCFIRKLDTTVHGADGGNLVTSCAERTTPSLHFLYAKGCLMLNSTVT
jgi:hypothetical protein